MFPTSDSAIQYEHIMVGISETSDDLNGWSIVGKSFKIGFTNNLIQH